MCSESGCRHGGTDPDGQLEELLEQVRWLVEPPPM